MAGAKRRVADSSLNSTASSTAQFDPIGLRAMVVDDDIVAMNIARAHLISCGFIVTACTGGQEALFILTKKKEAYDIVLLDVHMPGLNGFQVLEIIRLEMDIPVVMISADPNGDMIMKGLKNGACDYLVKPFTEATMKIIWQHVYRKRINKSRQQGTSVRNSDSNQNARKKRRMKWSDDLHQKFVDIVTELGINKATPKKILELMNVPDMTKERVASHLQKYKEYLKNFRVLVQHPVLQTLDTYQAETNPPVENQNSGTNHTSEMSVNTPSAEGQQMNVQPASKGASVADGVGSSESNFNDEDDILGENYLEELFNSFNEDEFADF